MRNKSNEMGMRRKTGWSTKEQGICVMFVFFLHLDSFDYKFMTRIFTCPALWRALQGPKEDLEGTAPALTEPFVSLARH